MALSAALGASDIPCPVDRDNEIAGIYYTEKGAENWLIDIEYLVPDTAPYRVVRMVEAEE